MKHISVLDNHLKTIPQEWRQPLVDVLDTVDVVVAVCHTMGIADTTTILELTKLVLDRHDRNLSKD